MIYCYMNSWDGYVIRSEVRMSEENGWIQIPNEEFILIYGYYVINTFSPKYLQ